MTLVSLIEIKYLDEAAQFHDVSQISPKYRIQSVTIDYSNAQPHTFGLIFAGNDHCYCKDFP